MFHSGQHSSGDINKRHREISINVPFTPPLSLVNNLSGSIINELYFRKNKQKKDTLIHYKPFFFPLDVIKSWNRAYGPKGFIQYQFLLPDNSSLEGINKILDNIIESDQKPFLGVIKKFGKIKPNGLMSFPREGTTLALDFKNNKKTHLLLNRLDEIVIDYEGSLYPAKDSRMSQKIFESSFPNLNEFTKFIDPNFSSSFWRRLRD